jgi:cell division protein FtsA
MFYYFITSVDFVEKINKTFIIKGSDSFDYDGFQDGTFFDIAQLKSVVSQAVEALKKSFTNKLETVYVGVPGDFTEVVVKDSQISFAKKKKITDLDVDTLFDSAFVVQSAKYTLINRSAVVYELDDFRRLANPVGAVSGILKGKLSFVLCTNYFIEAVKSIIVGMGVDNVEFVSLSLAQALYLLDADTRDRIAFVCDVGYISTTVMIIQGDGILYQKSFPYGGGYITADITQKFQIDFEDAEKLKRKVNLSCLTSSREFDLIDGDNGEYYSVEEIKNVIKDSLDQLCEYVSDALDNSGYVLPDYVTLMVTGGGISYLRGAKEHVSGRLNMAVEIIAPKVPLMDKPTESSILSLLDLALEQN